MQGIKKPTVALYVLNHNGVSLLRECLPSVCEAVRFSSCKVALRVIDNESTDESIGVLTQEFPDVEIIQSENNYLCSFNQPVRTYCDDVVILLNNDVKVERDFIDILARIFEMKDDAFMASAFCLDFLNHEYTGGLSGLVKKYGWWGTFSAHPDRFRNFPYTASVGACIAFRRDRYIELGGFDQLYLPGTLEDLDLCYRGWKRGWKGYFVPDSVIYHKGQASFKKKFGPEGIREMATRNTLLFIWKNVHDLSLLFEHLFWLGPRFIYALCSGDYTFAKGCMKAISRWRQAWRQRGNAKSVSKLSDREVLAIFEPLKA